VGVCLFVGIFFWMISSHSVLHHHISVLKTLPWLRNGSRVLDAPFYSNVMHTSKLLFWPLALSYNANHHLVFLFLFNYARQFYIHNLCRIHCIHKKWKCFSLEFFKLGIRPLFMTFVEPMTKQAATILWKNWETGKSHKISYKNWKIQKIL